MLRREVVPREYRVTRGSRLGEPQPGDVRCPSCGALFDPAALRVRTGSRTGRAICKLCHLCYGADGKTGG